MCPRVVRHKLQTPLAPPELFSLVPETRSPAETAFDMAQDSILKPINGVVPSRLISAAFIKWHTGKHATMDKVEISSEYVIRGIGGRHLMWAEVLSQFYELTSTSSQTPPR